MKTRVYQPPKDNPNCNVEEAVIPALGGVRVKLGEQFVITDEQDAILGEDERFPYVSDKPAEKSPATAEARQAAPSSNASATSSSPADQIS